VGTNKTGHISDRRLTYSTNGVLTYTPGTNEVLGLWAKRHRQPFRGGHPWQPDDQFHLAFPVGAPAGAQHQHRVSGRQPHQRRHQNQPHADSTNGNTFTYRYTGSSSGLGNGMKLVSSDQLAGYTCTVVSFTEITSNKTVVVVTQPTLLAELLQQGSLVSANFVEVTNGMGAKVLGPGGLKLIMTSPGPGALPKREFAYRDGARQRLNLNAELKLAANFQEFTLTAFQQRWRHSHL